MKNPLSNGNAPASNAGKIAALILALWHAARHESIKPLPRQRVATQ